MTGPEHYREAERLLNPKGVLYTAVPEEIPAVIAQAQVHATLALAAATALGARGDGHPDEPRPAGMHPEDLIAWDWAAGRPTQ